MGVDITRKPLEKPPIEKINIKIDTPAHKGIDKIVVRPSVSHIHPVIEVWYDDDNHMLIADITVDDLYVLGEACMNLANQLAAGDR